MSERGHRAVDTAACCPRASTGTCPSTHPRHIPTGPTRAVGTPGETRHTGGDTLVREVIGNRARRARRSARHHGLADLDVTWHDTPGVPPILCGPACGADDAIEGWDESARTHAGHAVGGRCQTCGGSDGGALAPGAGAVCGGSDAAPDAAPAREDATPPRRRRRCTGRAPGGPSRRGLQVARDRAEFRGGPGHCSARPSARFSTPRRASRRWWTRRAR